MLRANRNLERHYLWNLRFTYLHSAGVVSYHTHFLPFVVSVQRLCFWIQWLKTATTDWYLGRVERGRVSSAVYIQTRNRCSAYQNHRQVSLNNKGNKKWFKLSKSQVKQAYSSMLKVLLKEKWNRFFLRAKIPVTHVQVTRGLPQCVLWSLSSASPCPLLFFMRANVNAAYTKSPAGNTRLWHTDLDNTSCTIRRQRRSTASLLFGWSHGRSPHQKVGTWEGNTDTVRFACVHLEYWCCLSILG